MHLNRTKQLDFEGIQGKISNFPSKSIRKLVKLAKITIFSRKLRKPSTVVAPNSTQKTKFGAALKRQVSTTY